MKTINCLGIVALIAAGLVVNASPQEQSRAVSPDTLHFRALAACLEKEAATFEGKRTGTDYRNRIVEQKLDLLFSVPAQIGVVKVAYLDQIDLIERYRKTHKPVPVLTIGQLKSDGDKLMVGFGDSLVTYKNRRLTYTADGGCQVEFRYDCEKKWYALTKVELWGV